MKIMGLAAGSLSKGCSEQSVDSQTSAHGWLWPLRSPRDSDHALRFIRLLALMSTLAGCVSISEPPPPPEPLGFEQRCPDPAVVRGGGFDSPEEVDAFVYPPWGMQDKRGRVVTDVKASGAGSLRFEIPPYTGADTSG